ncbi:MAG: hypothetical protein ACKOYM_11575, partial [Actinomycetes bacterium]
MHLRQSTIRKARPDRSQRLIGGGSGDLYEGVRLGLDCLIPRVGQPPQGLKRDLRQARLFGDLAQVLSGCAEFPTGQMLLRHQGEHA